MDNENEVQADEVEETLDLPEVEEGQEDTTDWKATAAKLQEKAIAQRERTKVLKQQLKDKENAIAALAGKKPEPTKTGELDETTLDNLELRGISEPEDIAVIQKVMAKTGQTVRQTLKDDYVIKSLEANKAAREVRSATPGASRRSGASTDSVEVLVARYKASGYKDLPSDFKLRSAVVNAVAEETDSNRPPWMK